MSLEPQHRAARGRRISARGMSHMLVQPQHLALIEKISLEIFEDMVNAGHTFQEALSAIYFSGVRHTLELQKEPTP